MQKINSIRVILLVFIVVVIFSSFLGLTDTVLNKVFKDWDLKTDEHLTELSIKAGTAYGIARGLNGIISVVQGSDVNVWVGEILDPINDIVEKFSTIMLISLSSIGLQLLIHRIGIALSVRWFLSFAFVFLFIKSILKYYPGLLNKLEGKSFNSKFYNKLIIFSETFTNLFFLGFILMRFLIPTVAFVSMSTEDMIMDNYESAIKNLEEIKETSDSLYDGIEEQKDIEVLNEVAINDDRSENAENKSGLFSRFINKTKDIASTLDIRGKYQGIISKLTGIVKHTIDLIIIFVLQTMIIPLVTIWGLKALTMAILKVLLKNEHIKEQNGDVILLKS